MKKVWKEIKYWCQLFLLPIYWLSYLFPRSKSIWVFGSTFGKRFADNPKYLYLYLVQHKSNEVKVVWISKNRDVVCFLMQNKLKGYYLYSLKGIWYCLRAKIYLYDNYSKDICYTLSGGATKINLWHGIPLKKIQKDNMFDHIRNPQTIIEWLHGIPRRISDEKPRDYILSPSHHLEKIFSSAFRTKNVLVCDYPRNDVLLRDVIKDVLSDQDKLVIERLRVLQEKNRILLYMPTFRNSELDFFAKVDMNTLNQMLKKEHLILCVKLHPKSKLQKKFEEVSDDNILVVDSQTDPYPLCKLADTLITDYSSIYFDYLHTMNPIIFFPYDYKKYIAESRDLYFNYDEFTPGPKAKDIESLMSIIKCSDEYFKCREDLRKLIFIKHDESASERLYELIRKI